jgi:uncharacterized protein (TIGR00725 family)
MRKIIAVVGDGTIAAGSKKEEVGFSVGKALVDAGYRVQTGGLNGIMRATFKGCRASEKATGSDTIAILPTFDPSTANEYADMIIPTGLDLYRNTIVASGAAIIAIGGGSGTLAEVANAWAMHKLIIAFNNVDGWSSKLAGTKLDNRVRTTYQDDKIFSVSTAEEAIEILDKLLPYYTGNCYKGIPSVDRENQEKSNGK